ncbi:hypothetical protein [Paraburkholderia terricola]|uniref:Uncharacterized protein n=1 Tax=Paraburkholderia terricola TaxID=169427 RepID=A0A1M6P937_9BURK|nr:MULTISPECIES: hypothetical protein [Paraburkholderia]SDO28931.1 hypothetical protein SAMN05192547_101348 [Paraburkholderia sediminicola]SHK04382.1 hypothetical protein SAMN05192548_101248 [Paraburkholderia terricola]
MTDDIGLANAYGAEVPESLRILAGYLERALDSATSIVMMRHTVDACTVYLGDPAGLPEDLKQIGTIATSLANDMLELTASGGNQIHIDSQAYRFVRSFTEVGDTAAVVFAAD